MRSSITLLKSELYVQPGHATSPGEYATLIRIARLLDAVGGHQNSARELVEFLDLILPHRRSCCDQMLIASI